MLRLLVIVSLLAAAFAWLEPEWNDRTRTFSLRVREAREVATFLGQWAEPLNERFGELVGSPPKQPPVGAGPVPETLVDERLTDEDRGRLDRLIEEKTRER